MISRRMLSATDTLVTRSLYISDMETQSRQPLLSHLPRACHYDNPNYIYNQWLRNSHSIQVSVIVHLLDLLDVIGDVNYYVRSENCGSGFVHGIAAWIHALHFLSHFSAHVLKGIKNVCACIVPICRLKLCLGYTPSLPPRHKPACL